MPLDWLGGRGGGEGREGWRARKERQFLWSLLGPLSLLVYGCGIPHTPVPRWLQNGLALALWSLFLRNWLSMQALHSTRHRHRDSETERHYWVRSTVSTQTSVEWRHQLYKRYGLPIVLTCLAGEVWGIFSFPIQDATPATAHANVGEAQICGQRPSIKAGKGIEKVSKAGFNHQAFPSTNLI